MVAEIKITKPVLCLALRKAPPNQAAMLNKPGMKLTAGKFGNRPRDFTYDVSKADEIYDCLEKVGSPEHQVQLGTLKGQNPVCKFHASNSHATACVAFCHTIQDKIDGGLLKFPDKGKQRDVDWQATISQDRASSAGVYSWPLRRKPRIGRWTYGLHRRLLSCPRSIWSLQGNGCAETSHTSLLQSLKRLSITRPTI